MGAPSVDTTTKSEPGFLALRREGPSIDVRVFFIDRRFRLSFSLFRVSRGRHQTVWSVPKDASDDDDIDDDIDDDDVCDGPNHRSDASDAV